MYPGTTTISAETVLGDDVIDKLAGCGERIECQAEMCRHVHWALGFDKNMGYPTTYGNMLLEKLRTIYAKFNKEAAASEVMPAAPGVVSTTSFYAPSAACGGTSGRARAQQAGKRGRCGGWRV
jgi:hypothetical protein